MSVKTNVVIGSVAAVAVAAYAGLIALQTQKVGEFIEESKGRHAPFATEIKMGSGLLSRPLEIEAKYEGIPVLVWKGEVKFGLTPYAEVKNSRINTGFLKALIADDLRYARGTQADFELKDFFKIRFSTLGQFEYSFYRADAQSFDVENLSCSLGEVQSKYAEPGNQIENTFSIGPTVCRAGSDVLKFDKQSVNLKLLRNDDQHFAFSLNSEGMETNYGSLGAFSVLWTGTPEHGKDATNVRQTLKLSLTDLATPFNPFGKDKLSLTWNTQAEAAAGVLPTPTELAAASESDEAIEEYGIALMHAFDKHGADFNIETLSASIGRQWAELNGELKVPSGLEAKWNAAEDRGLYFPEDLKGEFTLKATPSLVDMMTLFGALPPQASVYYFERETDKETGKSVMTSKIKIEPQGLFANGVNLF